MRVLSVPVRAIAVLAVLLAACCLLTAPARAADYSDGGSGPGAGSVGSSPGGGGQVGTFDLLNTGKGIDWNYGPIKTAVTNAQTQVQKQCAAGNFTASACELTQAQQKTLSDAIGTSRCSSFTSAYCVLWDAQPVNYSNWGYRVHDNEDGQHVGDTGITGWNIKIWRQGVDQPIFERRICAASQPSQSSFNPLTDYNPSWASAQTDGYSSQNGESWNEAWWNCAGTNPYNATQTTTAGMLGQGSEAASCVSDYNNSYNGLRNLQGDTSVNGKAVPPGQRVPGAAHPDGFPRDNKYVTARPASQPSGTGWCY